MFRNATLVLAITLVLGSLSVARAEDPDQDFIEHLNAAGRHWEIGMRHHGAPFFGARRSNFTN